MLMKWFVARRGFVNGISSVFVAFGFSMAPLTFDTFIQGTSWRGMDNYGDLDRLFFTLFVFFFTGIIPKNLE